VGWRGKVPAFVNLCVVACMLRVTFVRSTGVCELCGEREMFERWWVVCGVWLYIYIPLGRCRNSYVFLHHPVHLAHHHHHHRDRHKSNKGIKSKNDIKE